MQFRGMFLNSIGQYCLHNDLLLAWFPPLAKARGGSQLPFIGVTPNLSKILASVVSIVSDFLENDFWLVKTNLFLVFFSKKLRVIHNKKVFNSF